MRPTLLLVTLPLVLAGPALARPVTTSSRVTRAVGSSWLGADLVRSVNVLQASLPAKVTLHPDAITLDVRLVLSSNAHVRVFARLGIGWFSRELSLTLPFLDRTFLRREVPIAQRTLRLGT